jgi:hypothetical protein
MTWKLRKIDWKDGLRRKSEFMHQASKDLDTSVKLKLYEVISETARMPTAAEIASALVVPMEDVLSAFERLHQKRLLVPEPDDPSRIRMAPPFSGIETGFLVRSGGKGYYANCIWDALGIPAALHRDARIEASDGFTGEPLILEVRDGKPVSENYAPGDPSGDPPGYPTQGWPYPGYFAFHFAIHFAVPAAHWWRDIIYT